MKDPEFLHFLHKQLLGFVPDHLRDGYEAILASAMDQGPPAAPAVERKPKTEKPKKPYGKVVKAVRDAVASMPSQFSAADAIKAVPQAAGASVYSALNAMTAKGELASIKVARPYGPPKNIYQKMPQKEEVADGKESN